MSAIEAVTTMGETSALCQRVGPPAPPSPSNTRAISRDLLAHDFQALRLPKRRFRHNCATLLEDGPSADIEFGEFGFPARRGGFSVGRGKGVLRRLSFAE
jgi:hypothetical protein